MNFIEATQSGFKKYFTEKGRASRSEYWYWFLFTFILGIVTGILDAIVFHTVPGQQGPISLLCTLATFIPSITVCVRRFHDIDKSGWWMLIVFTIIGIIPFVYWMCKKGDETTNRFGHDPLDMRYISSM